MELTRLRKPSRRADSNRGPLHYEIAAAFVPGCGPWRQTPRTSQVWPFRPLVFCGWYRVVCCHPVATLLSLRMALELAWHQTMARRKSPAVVHLMRRIRPRRRQVASAVVVYVSPEFESARPRRLPIPRRWPGGGSNGPAAHQSRGLLTLRLLDPCPGDRLDAIAPAPPPARNSGASFMPLKPSSLPHRRGWATH